MIVKACHKVYSQSGALDRSATLAWDNFGTTFDVLTALNLFPAKYYARARSKQVNSETSTHVKIPKKIRSRPILLSAKTRRAPKNMKQYIWCEYVHGLY